MSRARWCGLCGFAALKSASQTPHLRWWFERGGLIVEKVTLFCVSRPPQAQAICVTTYLGLSALSPFKSPAKSSYSQGKTRPSLYLRRVSPRRTCKRCSETLVWERQNEAV